tara:strand:+ start:88 stop:312 length:225 start_codon:yes stop_codon:yes gene_type:complete
MTNQTEILNSIIESCSIQLLKGVLPKNVKRGLTNQGLTEDLSTKILDKACIRANQFSHYKIGGKYCKENKHQNY